MKKLFAIAFAVTCLTGCITTSEVMEVRPGVYTMSQSNEWTDSVTKVRQDLIDLGKQYCAKTKKTFYLEESGFTKGLGPAEGFINFSCR